MALPLLLPHRDSLRTQYRVSHFANVLVRYYIYGNQNDLQTWITTEETFQKKTRTEINDK